MVDLSRQSLQLLSTMLYNSTVTSFQKKDKQAFRSVRCRVRVRTGQSGVKVSLVSERVRQGSGARVTKSCVPVLVCPFLTGPDHSATRGSDYNKGRWYACNWRAVTTFLCVGAQRVDSW